MLSSLINNQYNKYELLNAQEAKQKTKINVELNLKSYKTKPQKDFGRRSEMKLIHM